MPLIRLLALAMLWASGCGSSHDVSVGEFDAGRRRMDSGHRDTGPIWMPPDDAGPPLLDAPPRFDSAGIPMPPPGVVVCAGEICPMGEVCCDLTGECFDPATPSACAIPPEEMMPGACASSADCGDDELCSYDTETGDNPPTCVGAVGRCVARPDPTTCPTGGRGVCGCDGRTYGSRCAAWSLGVRVARDTPCGGWVSDEPSFPPIICRVDGAGCAPGTACPEPGTECVPPNPLYICGIDDQCPDGQRCCAITALCIPEDCSDCCYVPPDGTYAPCRDHADCNLTEASSDRFYCYGPGCDSPGGCLYNGGLHCTGELAPVCGCDGRSYANGCWAEIEGVRIAHEGECM